MDCKGFPCKYYFNGGCHRGNLCNYSHQNAPNPSTICRYFLKGTCIYGTKCSLSHQGGPLTSGGSSSASDGKEADPSLRSNEISDREKESDGSDVGWDRNASDQRDTESNHWDDNEQQSEDNRKKEKSKAPCHFFQHFGTCSKADNCGFAHSTPSSGNGVLEGNDQSSPSVQPTRKKEVCKHYLMGKCQMGDSCRFKHPSNGKERSQGAMSARKQSSPSFRSFGPADATISEASEAALINSSTSTWRDVNEEDVRVEQDTNAESINGNEDDDSKSQNDSNHDEMDDEDAPEDVDWRGSRHDERQMENILSEVSSPTIPQQRVAHEPTQPPTIIYPHVSEVSLPVHWTQFADPLANPEIPFCKLHAQSQCAQGEFCRFRHSITVGEYTMLFHDQQPNLWTLSRDQNVQHALHHRAPPPSFSTFSPSAYHSQPSLPQAPANLVQSTPSHFPQECKFFPLGSCRNGTSCRYRHTPRPVENSPKKMERGIQDTPAPTQVKSDSNVCKYFNSQKGCSKGTQCKFDHGNVGDSYPSSEPSVPQPSTNPVIQDNDDGWGRDWNGTHANNTANDNDWGQPAAATSSNDEWPPTDESSQSAPWVVAPVLCPHGAKGTCRKGVRCQLQHDVEARAPDTTDAHSRLQSESPQPNIEEFSHDEVLNTNGEDNQFTGSWGEGEIDPEPMADINDEEQSPKAAEPQDLYEEDLALKLEQQLEPVAPSAFEQPEVKFIMRCDVSFGPDALPDHVTTATETNKLVLSNLPLDISPRDIESLVKPFGRVRNSISLDETEDSSCIEVEFFDQSEARAAFKNLEGHEYEGRSLSTSLRTPMVAVVRSPTRSLNLKVSWPNPCILAWSHYPTIGQAKEEAKRLNGIIIHGRAIAASFVTPNKNQKTSFAIKLDNLALEVQKSDLEAACEGSTLITMEKPSYTVDATNSIRKTIGEFGSMEDFDTEPRTNTSTTSRAFIMFRNEGVAKQVKEDLDGQPQDFLGRQALTIRSIYYSRFRIPRMLFDAIKTDLDLLKAKCEGGSKKCTIQYYDHRDRSFIWVRITSPTSSHSVFAEINTDLLFFIEGTILRTDGQEFWDEYFETSSSTNAMQKIQEKTTTFVHCDSRAKNIRIFGSKACQEDAQKALMKLIGKVHTQRHEIDLPRPKLRQIVDDGFRSLQNDIGINKVSIDVLHSKLIVRGSSEDVAKAQNAIAAFAIDSQAVCGGLGGCQICHCDPIDSVTLSCSHAYCKACLHFAIKLPSQVPFCCISERTFHDGHVTRCEMPLGWGLIQLHFPSEKDELLRASFLHHVRTRREDLFFCPSLECQAVHRAGDESVNVRCSLCASEVCTFCKSHAHIGISCAERKALVRM